MSDTPPPPDIETGALSDDSIVARIDFTGVRYTCGICLGPVEQGSEYVVPGCRHIFCRACVVDTCRLCPHCRRPVAMPVPVDDGSRVVVAATNPVAPGVPGAAAAGVGAGMPYAWVTSRNTSAFKLGWAIMMFSAAIMTPTTRPCLVRAARAPFLPVDVSLVNWTIMQAIIMANCAGYHLEVGNRRGRSFGAAVAVALISLFALAWYIVGIIIVVHDSSCLADERAASLYIIVVMYLSITAMEGQVLRFLAIVNSP